MRPELLRTMRILWAAMLVSTTTFLAVILVLRHQGFHASAPGVPLSILLALVALPTAVMSLWLPRMQTVQALKRAQFEVQERPAAERMFADDARRARVFANPAEVKRRSGPALQTAMIVALALAESIALYGFVLLFLGYSWLHGLPFFIVCWGLMFSKYPSERAMLRTVEQAYDADLEPDSSGARSE
jgi:hypothetical protein